MIDIIALDDVDFDSYELPSSSATLRIGTSREVLPVAALPTLEQLTFTLAPGGPGRTWIDGPTLTPEQVPQGPARVLVDVLALTSKLPVEQGLVVESLAYSALLAGPDFAEWRARTERREPPPDGEGPVDIQRDGDVLRIQLNRPDRHNAFSKAMRDGLLDALTVPMLDPRVSRVELSGKGRSFCSGGDLDEFGTTPDVVIAHGIRLDRSCALAVHQLRDRVHPRLHGACLGAGIELPAFADHVCATSDAYFGLPELALGMIPGAGGTVSVTRRIGPWRTAYLVLTGRHVDAPTALAWGLIDELV